MLVGTTDYFSWPEYEEWRETTSEATGISKDELAIVYPAIEVMNLRLEDVVEALVYLKRMWNNDRLAISSLSLFLMQWSTRDNARAWHKRRWNRFKYKLFHRFKHYPSPNINFRPMARLPKHAIEHLRYYVFKVDPPSPPNHPNCRCTIISIQEAVE